MPLFDYLCKECGKSNEILVARIDDIPKCQSCGSDNMKKLLSAPSSMSGAVTNRIPGNGDTACCGSSPSETHCAGPGSCCGRS